MSVFDDAAAYWNMDAASGSESDQTGNGNDLSNGGADALSATGILNGARRFTGTSFESFLSANIFHRTSGVTFTGWVYMTDQTGDLFWSNPGSTFSKWDSANGYFYLQDDDGNNLNIGSGTGTGSWNFLAWWHDPALTTIGLRLNGSSTTGPGTASPGDLSNLLINASGSGDFNADEYGVWERVLSTAELDFLYGSGTPPGFSAGSPTTVTPGTASLALSTFAPTVRLGTVVTPGVAALTLTRFAPTVSTPVLCTPGRGGLFLNTFAPSVSIGNVVVPGTAALSLGTFAPTITLASPPPAPRADPEVDQYGRRQPRSVTRLFDNRRPQATRQRHAFQHSDHHREKKRR